MFSEAIDDGRHDDGRKPLGRLVEQQQLGTERERAGDRDHLALAAGERVAAALAIALEPREYPIGVLDARLRAARSLGHAQVGSAMFSATVSSPNTSLSSGAKPMPVRAIWNGRSPTMFRPSNSIVPATGRRNPMMVRRLVVLPAPLRPTRQTSSPALTSNDTPRSTGLPWISTARSATAQHHRLLRLPITVARARIGEEPVGRQIGQHLAFRQGDDAVRIGRHQVHVVLDQHDALDARPFVRRRSGSHDALLVGGRDAGGRLVQQDDMRSRARRPMPRRAASSRLATAPRRWCRADDRGRRYRRLRARARRSRRPRPAARTDAIAFSGATPPRQRWSPPP